MVTTLYSVAEILWRLSSSDLITFVLPNTLFGVCTSLCSTLCRTASIPTAQFSLTLFKTFLWNWLNLLLFNLSNQRLPEAIAEDRINKPYRPLASGLLSPESARKALLYGIPSIALFSALYLGAYQESIAAVALTWIYNDLKGSDENFVVRNLILAVSIGVYNHASTRIAGNFAPTTDMANPDGALFPKVEAGTAGLTREGQHWVVLISTVIFSTIQIQDLQDVEGDRKRGRRTMMLTLGLQTSRWITGLSIAGWALYIPLSLGAHYVISVLSTSLGLYVSWRVVTMTSKQADNISCDVWALWLIMLFALPLTAQ